MRYIAAALSLILCMCGICEAGGDLPQSINLESVGNARELGGYITADGRHVKHGVLLRTAALNTISSADADRLTKDYHLAVVADLRMSFEAAPKPDPAIDGVKYLNLRVINEESNRQQLENIPSGDEKARLKFIVDSGFMSYDLYVMFLSDDWGKNAYREFFRELAALPEGRSLLFHCTQGKDRTGCAAMLILSALGVNEDVILEDYMLTNTFNADLIAQQRKKVQSYGIDEADMEKYMMVLDEVFPKTMETVLSWLKENYGSPAGYITKELGITEAEIESLKAKFLER